MTMNGMQEFGALIRRAREQRGLTVVDLGNRIGRAHTAVVRIETGKSTNPPEPEVMRALERELGVSRQRMLEVMGYLDPPSNEDNAITIPATDPRAELLRALDGATDRDVLKVMMLVEVLQDYSRPVADAEPVRNPHAG